MREQVLPVWTKLKKKINSLKLSEQDKKVANYLTDCDLESFNNLIRGEELEQWAKKLNQIKAKLTEFDSITIANYLVSSYHYLVFVSVTTFLNWIEKSRTISDLESKVSELENWKRTSHHLLFKARKAIRTGMNNTALLWEIKEGELSVNNLIEAQEIRKDSAPMVKILTQIGQLDFIDEVYQDD